MRPRVLVVDDDDDIAASYADLIHAMPEDIHVLSASCPSQALAILRREPVDVVLTDYSMPGMTGLDMLEHARGRYKGAILVTAFNEDQKANLAARQGLVRRYMNKPGRPVELQQMIRELLFPEAMRGADGWPMRDGAAA